VCGRGASGTAERNARIPPEQRIDLRVGINLSDIMVQGDDIFGDGVNVAARLEALAEASGIAVSRVVRDQIRDKLPYPFEDMGELSVENIARPARVYALPREALFKPPGANGGKRPEMALKRPTVAPAEGLLTEAVLKHAALCRTAAHDPKRSSPSRVLQIRP
jgi:adenylate cyclase